jgi:hypothetical protein
MGFVEAEGVGLKKVRYKKGRIEARGGEPCLSEEKKLYPRVVLPLKKGRVGEV